MTGVDVEINPTRQTLKVSMKKYTEKLLKRFDMLGGKGAVSPAFKESDLYEQANKSNFPYRECVGALQWLATNTRPDIAHSTNMLARASCNPVTNAMAKCCRKVMQYLINTIDFAIEYSPESEKLFNEKYAEIAKHADNSKVDVSQAHNAVHTFTDASFGVTYKEMKSISGVVIYLYGTPVAWRSKVQTVFANSTTESEWIAMSDGIEVSQSVTALHHFLLGTVKEPPKGPLWCDNRGATLSARQKDVTDISKKTRHVALKFTRVLTQRERVWYCPTDLMKADGLTKSINSGALEMIFSHSTRPIKQAWYEEDEEQCMDDPESESWAHKFNSGYLEYPDLMSIEWENNGAQ
jgi:hypothetical protein